MPNANGVDLTAGEEVSDTPNMTPGAVDQRLEAEEGNGTAAPAATEPPVETEIPKTVPVQQYSRVYGRMKELERENRELANRQPAAQPRTPAAPAAQDDDAAWARRNVVDPLAGRMENIERSLAVSNARGDLNEYWSSPEVAPHADLRADVDRVYLESVAKGEPVHPDLILNTLIGQKARNETAARRSLATNTSRQVAQVNRAAAGANATNRVAPGAQAGKKKFKDMTTAEMEETFKDEVIWRRRDTEADLDD